MRRGFKHSSIGIIGVPEGEEEKQKIENLFENIMKENFPNLVKERKLGFKSIIWNRRKTRTE